MVTVALTMDGGAAELSGLLRLAKAGDLAAFEQIVLLHQRQVYRTARRLLANHEDAQDAAQEVLLRLHKHLRRFDEVRALSPWLYRVTVNVCRDVGRHRRHHTGPPPDADGTPFRGPDPHVQASLAEQRRLVGAALARLPEKERAAVVLRDIEGLPTSEVARILGKTEVTVRSQLSNGRRRLKTLIERFLRGQS
jgi:RNA polymerase sigma-70 factor (ECF subfamily)